MGWRSNLMGMAQPQPGPPTSQSGHVTSTILATQSSVAHLPAVCKGGHLPLLVQPHQLAAVPLPLRGQQLGHLLPDAAGTALQREPVGGWGWGGGKKGRASCSDLVSACVCICVRVVRGQRRSSFSGWSPNAARSLVPTTKPTTRPNRPCHAHPHPPICPLNPTVPCHAHAITNTAARHHTARAPEHGVGPPASILLVLDHVGDGSVHIHRGHPLAQPVALHHGGGHRPHLHRPGRGRQRRRSVPGQGELPAGDSPLTHFCFKNGTKWDRFLRPVPLAATVDTPRRCVSPTG